MNPTWKKWKVDCRITLQLRPHYSIIAVGQFPDCTHPKRPVNKQFYSNALQTQLKGHKKSCMPMTSCHSRLRADINVIEQTNVHEVLHAYSQRLFLFISFLFILCFLSRCKLSLKFFSTFHLKKKKKGFWLYFQLKTDCPFVCNVTPLAFNPGLLI